MELESGSLNPRYTPLNTVLFSGLIKEGSITSPLVMNYSNDP